MNAPYLEQFKAVCSQARTAITGLATSDATTKQKQLRAHLRALSAAWANLDSAGCTAGDPAGANRRRILTSGESDLAAAAKSGSRCIAGLKAVIAAEPFNADNARPWLTEIADALKLAAATPTRIASEVSQWEREGLKRFV